MTMFDSTKASLNDHLREICEGKIQLPDFQRGWVWDDEAMDALPTSHALAPALLRNDDFDHFVLKTAAAADKFFWVPTEARWDCLQSRVNQPEIGALIADAIEP